MKKVIKKLNKTLSVLLAAAMIVGSVPDVALVAQAEELTEEETLDNETADETPDAEGQEENKDAPAEEPAADPEEEVDEKVEEIKADSQNSNEPAALSENNGEGEGAENQELNAEEAKTVTVNVDESKVDFNITNGVVDGKYTSGNIAFTAAAKTGYELGAVTATGGELSGNAGSYTIANITGNVTIEVPTTTKEYTVATSDTTNATVSGLPEKMRVESDYTFTVTPDDGYSVSTVTVKYGDTVITTSKDGNTYTISKANLIAALANGAGSGTAEIKVTATATKDAKVVKVIPSHATVTYGTTNGDIASATATTPLPDNGEISIADGHTAKLIITADTNYELPETITGLTKASGYYTIDAGATSPITITATAIERTVTVSDESAKSADTYTANAASKATCENDFTFTVTPKAGYKIDTVRYGDNYATGENGVYTIPKEEIADDITITVKTYKYKTKVSYTQSDIASIGYDVNSIVGTYDTPASNGDAITVQKGDKIYLKATLKNAKNAANKDLMPVLNGEAGTKVPDDVSNTQYTFVVDKEVDKLNFTVVEKEDSRTYDVAESFSGAKVAYKYNCVSSAKKVKKGDDIIFTVTPDAKKAVSEVSYTISGGSKVIILPKDGVYTIPAAKITNDLSIAVETKTTDAKQFVVTFNLTDATVKVGENTVTSYTVDAGKAVEFTVVPENETYSIKYVSTTNSTEGNLTSSGNNKYSFTPTYDTTIYVKAAQKGTVSVAYYKKDSVSGGEGAAITVKKKTGDDTELTTSAASPISVKEGDDLQVEIKIADATKYKITKVTYGTDTDGTKNPVLTLDKDGRTTIAKVSENATITVFTSLDESKTENVYKLTYTVDGNAKVKVGGAEVASPHLFEKANTLTVTVEPEAGYEIVSVSDGDKVLTEVSASGDDKTYTLTYGSVTVGTTTKTVTSHDIKVVTALKKNTGRKDITVDNQSDYLTYEVDTTEESGNVEWKSNNVYTLRTNATKFDFKVYTKNNVIPVVEHSIGSSATVVKPVSSQNGVYAYSIPATLLAANSKISLYAKEDKSKLSLSLGEDVQSVKVEVLDKEIKPDADGNYWIAKGDAVAVKVKAKQNCIITDVTTKCGGEVKTTAINAPASITTYTASDDAMTIIVETKKITDVVIRDESGNTVSAGKDGIYALDYNVTYKATVETGSSQEIVGDASFGTAKTAATVSGNVVSFKLDTADAGNTITLKLYDKKGEGAKEVGAVTVKVPAVAQSVTANKVKDLDTTMNADTEAEITLAVTPAETDINTLGIVVKNAKDTEAFDATLLNGVITVTAPAAVGATATIEVYDKTVGTDAQHKVLEGGTIKLTTVAEKELTAAKVSVSQVAATDKALYVAIKGPKTLPELEAGKYFYKVEYTADESFDTMVASPQYVPYESETTNALITVDSAATDGKVRGFKVKATLVQASTAVTPTAATIIASSEASKEVAMSTRLAYLEDKLTLKKNATQIYTGQTTTVLTPVFSKNASYLTVVAEDITALTTGAALTFDYDGNEGVTSGIKATAANNTQLGNHTIRVTAYGPASMYKITATTTIKVVRGIESIQLTQPSEKLYKAAGKTATMQLTTILNNGNKNSKPASAKVTYKVFDGIGKENSKLKISNNGKLTVAKDYDTTVSGKYVTVVVKAADYATNGKVDVATIEITDEKTELGNVVITDAAGDVLAVSGSTIPADVLDGKYVRVIKKGVVDKDKYLATDRVDTGLVTFKSSNKAITIAADGKIKVTKGAKNVTITATAGDGSKNSAKLTKLTVTSAEAAALGLSFTGAYKTGVGYTVSGANDQNIVYSANASTTFKLQLQEKIYADSDWTNVPSDNESMYNYTISVKNAKVLTKRTDNNQPFTIMPTAKVATVTITNKDVKSNKITYTLTNEAFSTAKAPKVKVNGTLTAGRITTMDPELVNRTVDITVSGDSYKYVYVKADPSAVAADKKGVYNKLINAYGNALYTGFISELNNGSLKLEFNNNEIVAGSYKLQLVYGNELDEAGSVVPACKTVTVTIKAVSPVKVTYNLTKNYKMSLKDTTAVKLTGKGSKSVADVEFVQLYSKNISGKENKFLEIFDLDTENGILSIKSTVDEKLLTKDNLTGYVEYNVISISGSIFTYTTPITVTLKDSASKFTTTPINVLEGIKETDVNILANKDIVALKAGTLAIESADGITAVLNSDNSTITLSNVPAKAGNYNITLSFIPANSITTEKSEVKAKVVVKKGTASGKLALTKSTVVVENKNYTTAANDGKSGYYTAVLPYKMVTTVDASKLTFTSSDKAVVLENDAANKQIIVKIYRSDVTSANAGKTAKIKIGVDFGDKTIKAETLNVDVKYPKAVADFAGIVAKIKAADLNNTLVVESTEQTVATLAGLVVDKVEAEIEKLVGDSTALLKSDVAISVTSAKTAIAATSATSDGAAYITATVTNNATAADAEGRTEAINFVIRVKYATESTTEEKIQAKLNAYDYTVAAKNGIGKDQTVTNDTTVEDIVNDLKAYLKLGAANKLYISYVTVTPATDNDNGSIYFHAEVINVLTTDVVAYRIINPTITKLQTVAGLKTAIEAGTTGLADAIGKEYLTNDIDTIKQGIDAYMAKTITNKDIEYAYKPYEITETVNGQEVKKNVDVKITTPAGASNGAAEVTLVLWNKNSKVDRDKKTEVIVTLRLPALVTESALITAIQNAVKSESSNTVIAAATLAKNDADKIKKDIEDAVKTAIGNNGYTFAVTITDFKAATYENQGFDANRTNSNGGFKYQVAITKAGTTKYVWDDGQGASTPQTATIAASNNYQTAENLAREIELYFSTDTIKNAYRTRSASFNAEETVEGHMDDKIVNPRTDNNTMSVALAETLPADGDFKNMDKVIKYVAPTATTDGSLAATFVIKLTDNTGKVLATTTQSISVTLDKLAYDASWNEAKTEIADDIKAAVKANVTLTNEDNTTEGLAAKQQEILNVAQRAVKSGITVTVKSGSVLAITEATTSGVGNGAITLQFKDATNSAEDLLLSSAELPIAKLSDPATLAKAKVAVEAKLARLKAEDATTSATIVNKAKEAVKAETYEVKAIPTWKVGSFKRVEATVNAAGSVKDTLIIKEIATGKTVEVVFEKVIPALDQSLAAAKAAVTSDNITAKLSGGAATNATTEAQVKAAVEELVKKSVYTVTINSFNKTDATNGGTGSITFTVTITKTGSTSPADTDTTSTITLNIAQLTTP